MTGQSIHRGYIYYAQSHQRQFVEISDALRQETLETIASVTHLLETGTMPKPIYSKRCQGCSFYPQCLPQAANKVKQYREGE